MLAQELQKSVIKKFKRRKAYARFKDNIWAADLAEMGSLSSKNWGAKCLSCVINVFTKYSCIKPLKDKKAKLDFYGFIEIVNESKCKRNKLWVDQGKEFYNSLMNKWLDDNDIWIYLTQKEDNSIVAERFIRTMKCKIYKKWQLMLGNLILVIWIS